MTATTPPASPPAANPVTPVAWLRRNLFSNWFNSLLTVVLLGILGRLGVYFLHWAATIAQWQVIPANLPLFLVGRFPSDRYWRIWLLVGILAALAGSQWGIAAGSPPQNNHNFQRSPSPPFHRPALLGLALVACVTVLLPAPLPYRFVVLGLELLVVATAWIGDRLAAQVAGLGQWLFLAWALSPILSFWLLRGGFGLAPVNPNDWGGLLLTAVMSITSILLSFPLGILLALGRQNDLPAIRYLSLAYIEVVRGLPLLSILFFAAVMIPLFLPGNLRLDLVLRSILGLTLFSAAYVAETIRGGLQSIPRGQTEAARALGLSPLLTVGLILLPQALKISIPALVGLFISLLQDTTLVLIIGLFDLLGISRSILANPQFIGRYAEVYLFIGLMYWGLCYAMSWGSRYLEARLKTTH